MAIFNNQATLEYNGNVTNSNTATGELLEVLSATKTAVTDNYTANDDVTYVINIVNSGDTEYKDLTVTDDLGSYLFKEGTNLVPLTYTDGSVHYYKNGVLQPAPTTAAGPPLVFSSIAVPAHGNVTIIYEAKANRFAPLSTDGEIENTVQIANATISTPITATETISTQNVASLTISKTICPDSVVENGELTYTFIIQNSGNTAITTSDTVSITDKFDPVLNPIEVTFNGTDWTQGTEYAYSNSTGIFASNPGFITVPAATYKQDPTDGYWIVTPGVSTLKIKGTV